VEKPIPIAKTSKQAVKLAQQYHAQREARRQLAREVEKMEELEAALKKAVMDSLRALGVKAVGDGLYNYEVETKPEPSFADWHALWKYIQKTGDFDLLFRRVNPGAVKERWEQKVKVPGVVTFMVDRLSVTKAKGAD